MAVLGIRPDSFLAIVERVELKNEGLWRAGLGQVAIVARSAEDPTRNIANARARLRPLNDTSRILRQTKIPVEGVRLDSVALDGYLLEVSIPFVVSRDTARSLSRLEIPLQVRRGCTTYVEVYLNEAYRICEYGACPVPPERATLTVCREA